MRLVDIFSGCGGLSLGFDLCQSGPGYRTALAIDNAPSAVRIFNANFSRIHPSAKSDVGRLADVCWFETAQEIRLYYLAHIAKSEGDSSLRNRLDGIGFGTLLAKLRRSDDIAEMRFGSAASSTSYAAKLADLPDATFTLASVKKLLATLGVTSLNRPKLDRAALPWTEEYKDPIWSEPTNIQLVQLSEVPEADAYGEQLWLEATANIREGAGKQGRGQHTGNAKRYAALYDFLSTEAGSEIKRAFVSWRSERCQIVSTFLRSAGPEIDAIYFGGYRAEGLLGGPPCKGFSRIGRPVANALRAQGVFAWTNGEFGDERNKLVLHYVMFLEALQPKFFVFENVSNFQSSLKTPDGDLQADEMLAEAIENLSDGELHYDIAAAQLTASKFGVPQSRIRYIMFGLNRELTDASAFDFFKLPVAARPIGVAEAFFGLPTPHEFATGSGVSANTTSDRAEIKPPASDPSLVRYFDWIQQPIGANHTIDGHVYRRMRKDDEAFFGFVGPGIRWMDLEIRRSPTLNALAAAVSDHRELSGIVNGSLALRLLLEETIPRHGLAEQHLLMESYLSNGSGAHGDWLERLDGDRPAKTIVAHIGRDTYGYIHPYSTRPITLREAARLQSFPDSFTFGDAGMVDAYIAVGNAVPPLLAHVFAERVSELLFGNENRSGERKIVSFSSAQRRLV